MIRRVSFSIDLAPNRIELACRLTFVTLLIVLLDIQIDFFFNEFEFLTSQVGTKTDRRKEGKRSWLVDWHS